MSRGSLACMPEASHAMCIRHSVLHTSTSSHALKIVSVYQRSYHRLHHLTLHLQPTRPSLPSTHSLPRPFNHSPPPCPPPPPPPPHHHRAPPPALSARPSTPPPRTPSSSAPPGAAPRPPPPPRAARARPPVPPPRATSLAATRRCERGCEERPGRARAGDDEMRCSGEGRGLGRHDDGAYRRGDREDVDITIGCAH